MKPAVFLDRDGVLIENIPTHVRTWEEVSIFPYSTASLERLHAAGYFLFVITNQAIVARGGMSHEAMESLHERIMASVDPSGLVTKSYLCPHGEGECDCRKPRPGSLLKAAEEFGVLLTESFMVGDAVTDAQAGLSAGVKPIMVRTGRGLHEETKLGDLKVPVVDNLESATEVILGRR